MKHYYTPNHIILYIYRELDLFSKLEFEFALEDDSTLLEDYHSLKVGFDRLPKVTFSPSRSVTDRILAYSAEEAGQK